MRQSRKGHLGVVMRVWGRCEQQIPNLGSTGIKVEILTPTCRRSGNKLNALPNRICPVHGLSVHREKFTLSKLTSLHC